jgi:iron complex outermembrane receptor protein
LSATVDYYHVKKDDLIVAGPLGGAAKNAYYSNPNATVAQACASVAAVGPGYSCNTISEVDPLFPYALPRLLVVNAPFVNADSFTTEGIDFQATAKFRLPGDSLLTSRLEVTKVLKADLHTSAGVQKYAGTMGPNELSSGNGTPDLRANWQNTFHWKQYGLSTTSYWVNRIKQVATDEGSLSRDCVENINGVPTSHVLGALNGTSAAQIAYANQFCYVKAFVYTDVNATVDLKEGVQAYVNIGNIFGRDAPVAPGAYSSAPNYLITWSTPGVVGRTYKVGLRFEF